MKPRLKTSPAARELIKRFEPFRPEAERGEDGRWVVGYGHRAAAKAGVRVNEDEAALLLIYDVMRAEEVVDDSITGPLSRGQRDALTSFVHDVGVDRFRGSDVARYLFEGRARAAGEALAAFGEGSSARREAEGSIFLDALLPAQPGKARKSEPVELVIKIEHPSEERVLEGAIAGSDTPPPPQAYSDLPPPPPPFDAGLARRREAEDEIARILATVEALPPEIRQDLGESTMAPVAEAVADMSDDPIDATYQAIEDEDQTPDEDTAVTQDQGEAEAEAEANSPVAEANPDAAADRVLARMAEEIGDTPEPVRADDLAPEAPTEPVVADEPAAHDEQSTDPSQKVAPDTLAPMGAFDLPEGMGLGFVLSDRQPDPAPDMPGDTAADAETADETSSAETSVPTAAPLPEHYSMDLPAGMGLGYALTNVIQGSFRADPQSVELVRPADDAGTVDETDIDDPVGLAAESDLEEAPETVAEEQDGAETEAEIVERAVTLSGEDTPPPHPAETPAMADGAVGDVAGEPVVADDSPQAPVEDDLGNDPMMADSDPLTDGMDDFSPSDLAADVHTTDDRPGPRSDDGLWTFVAVLFAGGLLAGFGSVLAASEWDYIIAQREMTLNFGMALAGFFLVIVAGWQLASIWLAKLKQKASN